MTMDESFNVLNPPSPIGPIPRRVGTFVTAEQKAEIENWHLRKARNVEWFDDALEFYAEKAARNGRLSAEDLQHFCTLEGNPHNSSTLHSRITQINLLRERNAEKKTRKKTSSARVIPHFAK